MSGRIRLLAVACACAVAGALAPVPRPAEALASVSHVVHVSVDGLNASMLADLMGRDPLGTAAFHKLVDEGASTFDARTDATHTTTLPNHTSMLTGRPVAAVSGLPATTHHGYTDNSTPPPGATLHTHGNPAVDYIPSVFDVVHDNGLSTALLRASKTKFSIFEVSYDALHGRADTTGPDDGRDKIDTTVITDDADATHAAVMEALTLERPAYTFVHYRNPDSAGHATGWGSAAYDAAIVEASAYLTQLLATIESDPVLSTTTVVIVTSDHGGTGDSHGNVADPQNSTIPFFTWGAGVSTGADLYELNPDRSVPLGANPGYQDAPQPIRNGDAAALALTVLDLDPIDGSLMSDAPLLHEPVRCRGRLATIIGTQGPDVIYGTAGDDVISGLGGDDTIRGRAGDDVICGGAGRDTILGGIGRDRLFGGPGDDLIRGGPGRDILAGGPGSDRLRGGSGRDLLSGGSGIDFLVGGDGNDRLVGGRDDDVLRAGAGADVASGGQGTDRCEAEVLVSCER